MIILMAIIVLVLIAIAFALSFFLTCAIAVIMDLAGYVAGMDR